jgi:ATP-dependent protease ClpP protease subunit
MFKIKAQGKKAEIYIYEDIGSGWFGGIGAADFKDQLKELGEVEEINVRINSIGGDVFEGLTIYNLLNAHDARITVDIDGAALSIASVIAMAGDIINIAENAQLMIHDPWSITGGTAEDLRSTADVLDNIRDSLLGVYDARTGGRITREDISAYMNQEKWFTATEARDAGFVDNITDNLAIAASGDLQRYKYKHKPKDFKTSKTEQVVIAIEDGTPRLDAVRARLAGLTSH